MEQWPESNRITAAVIGRPLQANSAAYGVYWLHER